jgi:hypothetical protein
MVPLNGFGIGSAWIGSRDPVRRGADITSPRGVIGP